MIEQWILNGPPISRDEILARLEYKAWRLVETTRLAEELGMKPPKKAPRSEADQLFAALCHKVNRGGRRGRRRGSGFRVRGSGAERPRRPAHQAGPKPRAPEPMTGLHLAPQNGGDVQTGAKRELLADMVQAFARGKSRARGRANGPAPGLNNSPAVTKCSLSAPGSSASLGRR